jgi:hypothetical protein
MSVILHLGISPKNSHVLCCANGVQMAYRLFREADTWLVGIDYKNTLPAKPSVYREFTSYRAACQWANADFRRRQTLRLVA